MIPGVIDSSGGRILGAFSDAFTRADSTTISTALNKWQELRGDWSISSNRLATAAAPSTNPIAVVQTNTKNAQVQIGQGSSGFGWGVAFWAVDADNYYVAVTEMAAGSFTFYTCPTNTSVVSLVGTTCTYPADYAATATSNTTYSCPSGGTLSGTTCNTVSYSCSVGYLVGTNCYFDATMVDNISDNSTPGCSNTTISDGIYLSGCGCFGNETGDPSTCTCYSNGLPPDPMFGCAFYPNHPHLFGGTCWANARSGCVYYPTAQTAICYVGTWDGTRCYLAPADASYGSYPATATTTTTYSCPTNTSIVSLSGTTCVYPADYAATANSGTNYSHTIVLKRSVASTVTTVATSSAVVTSSSTARPSYVRVNTSGEAITISAPLDNGGGTISLSHTATGALRGKKHGVALSSVSATAATNVDNFEYQPA